jgi:catenin beta 1
MDNPAFPNNGYGNQGPFMSPVDSAFVSGNTTKAPSVVGDIEDLDQLSEDFPPPNATIGHTGIPSNAQAGPYPPQFDQYHEQQAIANDQIMQTTGDRVRMTMFPDHAIEEDVPSTQVVPDHQTNLQRMTQPVQILRAAVQNLVNYQSNTELTARALPEILQLLSHQDQSIVLKASKLILDLCKKDASIKAFTSNPNGVFTIIQTLANINNPEIQKALAGAIHNISSNSQGLMMIYKCGGIPYLVRLLTSQVDAVLFYAVATIHNLLFHFEPAKMDVRLAGGLEKLVALLIKDNVKFLAIAADSLHILAYGHQDSKLIILASGGPAFLVRILRIYTYEKLLWTVSRLLKVLSVCPSNKAEILQAGGMQALALHVGHRSGRLVQNILFALRNLSDAATKQDNLDDLLSHLIGFLSSPDVNIVTCSAGVLSNLTCNTKNKTIVCQLQGVEALLRAISNNVDKIEVVERCVCSLRHITSRHPGDVLAQNSIRELNGIPMLMNLLQPQTRWELIKALIGLFRNLALSYNNHTALREQGCIPKLWQLLNRSLQELQRSGQSAEAVDGISMNQVVDCSTTALHLLARDEYNRLIMRQLNVIPTFVQLLKMSDERIQRAAVGALSELALDPEGADQIEREGACDPLASLLHSKNEGIAAYAAAVLFCLSEDKNLMPGEISGAYRPPYGFEGPYYSGGNNPLFNRLPPMHYSNSSSHPGSTPFTPNMSEPPSGLMTPHSEFDLPLDFDDLSRPGSGFHSSHHSGIHTPNHHYASSGHHSGVHTPGGHHSGVHTPTHSGLHTPNHYPMSHPSPMPSQPIISTQPFPTQAPPPPMGPGYFRVQQGSYNPPSPALMDTANNTAWLDTDL